MTDLLRVGVVCGLKSEASTFERAMRAAAISPEATRIGVSGARAAEARAIAGRFAEEGVEALWSVGVSGGIDPRLKPGDVVVATSVRALGGSEWPTSRQLIEALPKADAPIFGALLGSDDIIQTTEEKARLFAATGALAVDMESHAVAQVASERGLPFLAIRAIADPADRALPPAAMNAVAPDGSTRVFQTLLECVRSPAQLPALIELGGQSNAALAKLRGALQEILPTLANGSRV